MPHIASARFGDYELLETIGRGGMGVVYKARQLSLNRLIALKMLNPHSAAFPRVAERLLIEAEAAGSLRYPNIVTIYEVGQEAGRPFFTMTLIEGAGMDKFIEKDGYRFPSSTSSDHDRAREPQATVVRTLITIARAVDYAHKHGVLHRDLKPANVVIDATGEPHLTDFGLAKILGRERTRETDSGSIMGTPAYMAPEQAAGGTKRVSTAADIYSLGAVFYEMLTGHPPFRSETPLETLRQVTEEVPKSPTTMNNAVDADLATICLKCLEKTPERRYPTALALAEDLERWLRHEPIEARPLGTMGQFWRWCHREPRLAAMTTGLILLLSATTLLALKLYYRERERLNVAQDEKNQQKHVLRGKVQKTANIQGGGGVRIAADELAVLAERPLTVEGNERKVVVGVHLPRYAVGALQILQRFEPFVNCLQTNHAFQAELPLLFELHIYTTYSDAMIGLSKEDPPDLMLLSPASYVRLRSVNKEVQPLVRFLSGDQRAIRNVMFTGPQSKIRQLADLKGKSLAFAFLDLPLVEDCVKSEMWSAGLRSQDLKQIEILSRGAIVSAVQARRFDVGVAALSEVARFTNAGLRLQIIHEVATPGYIWVSTGKLPPTTLEAIRNRLRAMRDPEVLAPLDEVLTGFEPAIAQDFDDMEWILEQSRRFDESK